MIDLRLPYQAPHDWARTLHFLSARSTRGVELVRDDAYLRTVRLGDFSGWFRARNAADAYAIVIDYSTSLATMTDALTTRLRHLFDLDARPDVIAAHFANDALLGDAIRRRPGLRVPGAFDGFELATRAILGQQITVRAATTIAGRFAAAFGESIDTPHVELTQLPPSAARLARATVGEIAALGIIQTRARSIIAVAQEMESGRLTLEPGAPVDATIARLVALPGIGPWTAQYIAMRAVRWPDAFPPGDIALRNALGGVTARRAEELSEPWRPWRSYATLHLWCDASEGAVATV